MQMSIAPFNLQGFNDVARARCGGDDAKIIRQTYCEAGPISLRLVMTETRKTLDNGVSMPVCWAIVTKVYALDADGYDVLHKHESVWTDASVLEGAWEDAKNDAVGMCRTAYEWFLFEQEVAK
jgi:hypothetical protein